MDFLNQFEIEMYYGHVDMQRLEIVTTLFFLAVATVMTIKFFVDMFIQKKEIKK